MRACRTGRDLLLLSGAWADIAIDRKGEKIKYYRAYNEKDEAQYVIRKIKEGKAKILIGARSAIFAPLTNIGLVVIDEEHENTYKQTSPAPRYDARTVALKICELHNASLITGSATPDIGSYFKAVSTDNLITLNNRFNNTGLAKVTVVDMREEFYRETRSIFSNLMINEINQTLKEKKQIILLMNRRGFYTSVQCRTCGELVKCPKCDIPMIYHNSDKTLKCHWCNSIQKLPDKCPKCGSSELNMSGMGTQRVESIAAKLFPDAGIERIDSDVLSSKYKYIDILDKFQNGEIDILIGTQMIAKGLDNPNVTLVGVISADASFNLPDFRASERGFQLLTQVAGRAGRGEFKGRVLFQTYNPEYYALESAKSQNYAEFYRKEITSREDFDYPPFSQIIRLILSSQNKFRAEKAAQEIALRLCTMIEKFGFGERLEVLGPTACVIERINSYYRFQILIKNKLEDKGHQFVSSFLSKITSPKDIRMTIDVDPLDIL